MSQKDCRQCPYPMEIQYQLSKSDYITFYKSYLKARIRRRPLGMVFFTIILIIAISGKEFIWWRILSALISSPIITIGLLYLLPLVIILLRFNKILTKTPSLTNDRKISVVDKGIEVSWSEGNIVYRWQNIEEINSIAGYVYLILADKKLVCFPKSAFSSEAETGDFISLIQNKLFLYGRMSNGRDFKAKKKPSYFLGLLCLIPGWGAIAGIVFIAIGTFKYKDRVFVLIGSGGIVFTASLYYLSFFTNIFGFQSGMAKLSQRELNSVMKDVEFYKMRHSTYPDSLGQLGKDNSDVLIYDPLLPGETSGRAGEFNYQRVGDHYYLFSSGIDRKPHTKDDIYPELTATDSGKFGLIIKQN
jgi:hypothetical protein